MKKNDELLILLESGDEASFKIVYNHFYSRLFFFILEYIPNKDIVENILQDTFLVLWQKRNELNADTNLNAYLYTIAKNNSLKKLREKKYQEKIFKSEILTDVELELHVGALGNLNTSELIFDEIESIIQKTLDSLSPQSRLVFEMSRFDNKKNREIAEELGISIKTVEGHITKAIKSFKISLKDYLPIISFLIKPF